MARSKTQLVCLQTTQLATFLGLLLVQRRSPGVLPIANGGTGSSTAGGALTNLGAQPVDAELTAISGLAGTGFAVQTGAGTYGQRTIVGVSPISVADGVHGVAGNPTISYWHRSSSEWRNRSRLSSAQQRPVRSCMQVPPGVFSTL
ncbi:MAG: hypothetical protein IPI29_00015 [Ignavibacteria bacterium]|nr:hypothetical protein [Ignavibacteria bacterium]